MWQDSTALRSFSVVMIDVGIPLPGLFMFASIMRFKRCMSFRGLYSSQCRGIIESLAFCVLQTNPFEIRQALKTCICTGVDFKSVHHRVCVCTKHRIGQSKLT